MEEKLSHDLIGQVTLFLRYEDYKNWMRVSKSTYYIVTKIIEVWSPSLLNIHNIDRLPVFSFRKSWMRSSKG